MKCNICGSENIVEGVVIGINEGFKKLGPKYKEGFKFIEQMLCDLCDDCGEIHRFYVRPKDKRNWVISSEKDLDLEELERKRNEREMELTKEEIEQILSEYSELILSGTLRKRYVRNLDRYKKHELYEYPVQTKGPSYRLYRELSTNREVMIKRVTMELDKGNYLVYELPSKEDSYIL